MFPILMLAAGAYCILINDSAKGSSRVDKARDGLGKIANKMDPINGFTN